MFLSLYVGNLSSAHGLLNFIKMFSFPNQINQMFEMDFNKISKKWILIFRLIFERYNFLKMSKPIRKDKI